MQLTQSKTVELLFTAALAVTLLLSALHAKDITPQLIGTKTHKVSKDDSQNSGARKVINDWHNHIDKFSMKSLKVSGHLLGADNRSLKKQNFSNKRLQNILD